jgi:hypothetical protein
MLTYHDSSSWHSAPETWQSISFVTHSTRSTRRAGGGGTTTGSTTANTTIQAASSTASTSNAGGPSPGASFASFGDTGSTTSNAGGSTSTAYTRSTVPFSFTTSDSGIGLQSLTDTTSTRTASIAWPSTYTTTTALGTYPDTTETTTRTAATSVTGTRNESYYETTTGAEISSTETFLSFGASVSTQSHKFPALAATVIVPDASSGPLFNDAIVWVPTVTNTTADTTISLFPDLFSTTASGNQTVTVGWSGRILQSSTVWLTYSLSTDVSTITQTTTGTASTITGTQTSTEGVASLDGAPWNSTEAPETSTIWIGSVTGSSTYTAPGPVTLTDYTYTRQSTSWDAFSNVETVATTVTLFVAPFFTTTWNTWQRSLTASSTFSYPRSTTTASLFQSFSTNSREIGTTSISLDEWQELTTTTSWTSWDHKTNAVLNGNFTTSAAGGGTTSNTTSIVAQTYNRTDYSEAIQQVLVSDLSIFGFDWTMGNRVWQRMLPKGIYGFGDGFATSASLFTGITSALVSGDDNTGLTLGSGLPKFIMNPDASVFATGSCWNHGNGWSGISGTWVGSTAGESGPRTTASFLHRWVSTGTTTSNVATSTVTTSSTVAATYGVSMAGHITGEFWSEYTPKQNSSDDGTGRPLFSGFLGGAMGGLAPISSIAQTATFPPGGVTLTWETAPGATSSSSTSTSTGPITIAMPSATAPAAYSFQPALLLSWVDDTALQILTASVHDFPDYPY